MGGLPRNVEYIAIFFGFLNKCVYFCDMIVFFALICYIVIANKCLKGCVRNRFLPVLIGFLLALSCSRNAETDTPPPREWGPAF